MQQEIAFQCPDIVDDSLSEKSETEYKKNKVIM